MITIDESLLIGALRETADAFEISHEARDRILSDVLASDSPTRSERTPGVWRGQSRRRHALMAAAVLIVLAGVTWPLVRVTQPTTRGLSALGNHGRPTQYRPSTVQGLGTRGGVTLSGATPSPLSPRAPGTASPSATSTLSPKIMSTGSVSLRVRDGRVERAFTILGTIATTDGGFVLSSQAHVGASASNRFSYGTIVLQVPQRTFTTLVAQVQRVGHATSVVTSSNDVTGQYVDLQARITALEASRRQYLQIMTRATSIGDILAVQSQLDTLQSELEQIQGQLSVLAHATTYATLTVSLSEAGHPTPHSQHFLGLRKAWHDAIGGFVAGVEWLIRLSGPALFAALCLSALFVAGKFTWRATRRRRIR